MAEVNYVSISIQSGDLKTQRDIIITLRLSRVLRLKPRKILQTEGELGMLKG
jgi:hypothetical protein